MPDDPKPAAAVTPPTATPAPPASTPEAPARYPAAPETDWKAEARKWEQRAKDNKAKLDEAAPKLTEYDALIEASKSDLERANEQATRNQGEAETWRKAAIGARVEALAATDFADTSDAVGAIGDLAKYLDASGQIDEQAIRTELAALLERKPHWRKEPASRVPAPTAAVGASAAGAPDAEAVIAEAKKKGDWRTVVALENQKLVALAAQQR